jgi:hypothetical protein
MYFLITPYLSSDWLSLLLIIAVLVNYYHISDSLPSFLTLQGIRMMFSLSPLIWKTYLFI